MQIASIINLLAFAVVCVAIYHGATILARKLKERDAKKLAADQELARLLGNLVKALEALAKSHITLDMRIAAESERFGSAATELQKTLDDAAKMSEKILIGTTKACEAIAITTEKHRETVASLGKLLFGPGAGKDALTQPSERDRDQLAAEMAYRAQGHSPEKAKALAEAEMDREGSLPNY